MTNVKICPVCSTAITGRSDKLFCSLKCKSIHQYESRQKNERFFLKVDRQLKINRKLLKRYNKSGLSTIRRAELIGQGFDPKFFTHYWKNQKGEVYLFVYEYGFLRINTNGKDKYVLIKWQSYMDRS
ncbi:hypothetical protein BTR34_16230 [Maribacter hydrothermalis]|uniref:DUF2116 family Zn-ribbon domain-containing protein n=1 Tax=Maribacter hydrothermalis TaxID=1836467 RepID=UPI000941B373|nr:hypothetical protein BTR34_16230 [Maribacter hydrothermalis]